MTQEAKKTYVRPQGSQLKVIGSVADLTHTGITQGGGDAKGGSASSQGR